MVAQLQIAAFPTIQQASDEPRYNEVKLVGAPTEPTRQEINTFLTTLSQIVYRQSNRKVERENA